MIGYTYRSTPRSASSRRVLLPRAAASIPFTVQSPQGA